MADTPARDVFVGRHREMDELKAALDEALAGQGRLVMLVGEPGIGKTRLAQEVASHATELGFRVLWGWCYEEEGAPPYWPWVQSLRAYGQQLDPDLLRSQMGPGAADIAEIVPEIREKLPGLELPPALEPEQARFRLFDSITAFVKNAAQAQPLMLVLDDLHWADKSSLLLLQFLARQLGGSRLLVAGCYRDVELSRQHPLSEALAQLSREPVFRRVLLRGLSQGDSEPFIQAMAGIQPPQRLVETIYTTTEGNPFFMKEVVRLLSERGELTAEEVGGPRGIRIPEGVREAIGQRLNRLSEPCNQALTTASIVGREFDFKVLDRSSSGVSEDQLLLAIDEALAAHLIEEVTGTGERYKFTHALVQQTLAEELSSSRRVRLHARIGEVLEELYGVSAEAHADELAYHFLRGNKLEKAAEYALKAGDRASAVYGWEQATAYYQTALELLTKLGAGPRQQAEALEKLGQATTSARGSDASQYLEKALSLYEAIEDQRKAAEVRISLSQRVHIYAMGADAWERAHYHSSKAVEFLEREGGDSLLARAYARLSDIAAHVGKEPIATAVQAAEKGLALAKQLGDATAIRETAMILGHVQVFHAGQIEQGLRAGQETCEAAREGGDALGLAEAASYQSFNYAALLDCAGALGWAEEATSASEQSGALSHQMLSQLALAWASILRGDTLRALSSVDRVQQLSRRRGVEVRTLPTPAFGVPGLAYFLAGEWEKAEEDLLQCLADAEQVPIMPVLQVLAAGPLGRLLLERGDVLSARRYLEKAVAVSSARGEMTLELGVRTLLAEVAARAGDMEEAATHLRRANEIISNGEDWLGLVAEVRLAEATLATVEERWQEAEAAFQKASEIYRQRHLPYFEARCLMEWGQMYVSRNGPSDRERGMELLGQALTIFQRIQAKKMVEKVAALQERIEAQPRRGGRPLAPVYPDGLSQREVEVLRLIALGKSNREIAEELVISLNTVTRHVSNIFSKTGAANRTEAATYALRHGLVQ